MVLHGSKKPPLPKCFVQVQTTPFPLLIRSEIKPSEHQPHQAPFRQNYATHTQYAQALQSHTSLRKLLMTFTTPSAARKRISLPPKNLYHQCDRNNLSEGYKRTLNGGTVIAVVVLNLKLHVFGQFSFHGFNNLFHSEGSILCFVCRVNGTFSWSAQDSLSLSFGIFSFPFYPRGVCVRHIEGKSLFHE